jgi:hypothetical protein
MRAREDAGVSGGAVTAWIIITALVCVGTLGWGAAGRLSGSDGPLAYRIGASLVPAAVLAGVMHVFFRHRLPAWFGGLGFALIFASLVGASTMSMTRQRQELRSAAREVSQVVAAVQSSVASGTALPPNLPTETPGRTDAEKAGVLLKAMVNRSLTERRNYMAELDALGWTQVLDGARLRQDRSFAETRNVFERARDIVAKYRMRTTETFAAMRRDIENSDLSSEGRRGMLAGFDKTSERGLAHALQSWTLEEQILSEIEGAAQYLHANRSAWTVESGKLAFLDQGRLDRFNAYMSRVQALSAEQQKMQGDALQRSQETLSKLGGG